MTPHTVIPWDGVAYCTNGDGNPATVELPSGMAGDHPVVELVCFDCADKENL
jgi:hypothetical protein